MVWAKLCYNVVNANNGFIQVSFLMLDILNFHFFKKKECLKEKPAALPVPGDRFYNFQCAVCNKKPTDTFTFIGKSW